MLNRLAALDRRALGSYRQWVRQDSPTNRDLKSAVPATTTFGRWLRTPRASLNEPGGHHRVLWPLTVGLGLTGMVVRDATGKNPGGLGFSDLWALPLGLLCLAGLVLYLLRPVENEPEHGDVRARSD